MKIKIYLADLVHNYMNSNDIWMIPLNVASIAAYALKNFPDDVEIKLFKFPQKLMEAIEKEPPHIVGFSNYIWNANLNKQLSSWIKDRCPQTIICAGGPNFDTTEAYMGEFFNTSGIDFYILHQGEMPFCEIIRLYLGGKRDKGEIADSSTLVNVAYINRDGVAAIRTGHSIISELDEIPSPYLTGLMDEFMADGLMPVIETNRGCPYGCTFCMWGEASLSKIYKYSEDRIKAELSYIASKSVDKKLFIADANFGILQERDLRLAEFLKELSSKSGYPEKITVLWAKSKNKVIWKIAEELKELTTFAASFQSLDPDVLDNIKRTNLSVEQFQEMLEFSRINNIETMAEFIYGLPGEKMGNFLDSLRLMFAKRVENLYLNQLVFLEGSNMSTLSSRTEYGIQTRYRLMENCYGIYFGKPVFEIQEVVYSTETMAHSDIMTIRVLNWLIYMSWNLKQHSLLLRYLMDRGVNPIDFLLSCIDRCNSFERIGNLFDQFVKDADAELFSSPADLIDHYSVVEENDFKSGNLIKKLNTAYSAAVFVTYEKEFLEFYIAVATDELLKKRTADKSVRAEAIGSELNNISLFMSHMFIEYDNIDKLADPSPKELALEKMVDFEYNILAWHGDSGVSLDKFKKRCRYKFSIPLKQKESLKKYLDNYSGMNHEYRNRKMRESFVGMPKKYLYYEIENINGAI
jgi:radical SAM superfamily enzyme YgiQ (UPF0313 family)